MNKVYLGLGSNKGDRLAFLRQAIFELEHNKNIEVVKCASVYETKPYGVVDQENYFNSVVEVYTNYSLDELYDCVKAIENKIGRKESFRWGPREIDIDILLYGDVVFSDVRITIPHKDLLNRDFVLKPLLEISSNIMHPKTGAEINISLFDALENHVIKIHEVDLLNYLGAKVV